MPVERFRTAPLAVRAVLTLRTHDLDTIEFRSAPPEAAVRKLVRHSYRRGHLRGLGGWPEYLRDVVVLARQARVSRVLRPVHSFLLDELADEVERHLHAARREEAAPPRIAVAEPAIGAQPGAAGD